MKHYRQVWPRIFRMERNKKEPAAGLFRKPETPDITPSLEPPFSQDARTEWT